MVVGTRMVDISAQRVVAFLGTRHNLPQVQKLLQEMCLKHGVNYKVVSFLEGNKEIVRTLEAAAMKARKSKVVDFTQSDLWKSMCAEG